MNIPDPEQQVNEQVKKAAEALRQKIAERRAELQGIKSKQIILL